MKLRTKLSTACVFAAVLFPSVVFGQKVKVDYDKSVEFAKFKTYTWAKINPTGMPLLTATIMSGIDDHLQAKGLAKVEKNGDLIVTYAGALEGEANQGASAPAYSGYSGPPPAVDSTVWTGSTGSGGSGGSVSYPKGTLVVELMDPSVGKITWRGVGKVKIDLEKKKEALSLVSEVIDKMFAEYPPKEKK
jgi:hypothetical protein